MNLAREYDFCERILVIFPGALGDFIAFVPALEKLAGRSAIDLLARSEYGALLPPAIRSESLERREVSRLFAAGAEADGSLRDFFSRYACVYSWAGSRNPRFVRNLRLLTGGKARIFPFHPPAGGLHRIEYYLSCLADDPGRLPQQRAPDVWLRPEALAWAERFWIENGLEGKQVLAAAPGSGAREKNWPVEFYAAVVERWERRSDRRALLLFGPAEEERGEADYFAGRALGARSLDLARLASLLRRSALYLGNDSGITHLAAAVGVETFALFGPTDPVEWAPRGRSATVISQKLDCSPCAPSVMRACSHRRCLGTLSADKVAALLEKRCEELHANGADLLLDKGGCRH